MEAISARLGVAGREMVRKLEQAEWEKPLLVLMDL